MAHLNIEHYKKLLAAETDPSRRQLLTRLLAEEEAKLAKIAASEKPGNEPPDRK